MRALFLTVLRPVRAAGELKSRPRWILVFLVLSAASIANHAFMHPYLVEETVAHLPGSATDVDRETARQGLDSDLAPALAFLPIRLFIGWSAFSLLLFFACRSLAPREPVRFLQVFSLEVHAEVTSVIAGIVTTIVTFCARSGMPAVTPLSLAGPVGGDQSFMIKSLLTSLNIFTLWYILLLTIAVCTLCNVGRMRAIVIVLLAWAFSTMCNLGTLKLLHDQLHLVL